MPWLAALDRARRSRSSVPGAPAYIIPCSNILATLRNSARDDMCGPRVRGQLYILKMIKRRRWSRSLRCLGRFRLVLLLL